MILRRTLSLIPIVTATLILGWPAFLHAENAVRYTDATAQPGDIVTINMIMENDVVISGAYIPFRWSSPDISLLGVEILRDRFQGVINEHQTVVDPQERTSGVFFVRGSGLFEQGWVNPGSGVLARLTFQVSPGAAEQVVYVDSVYKELDVGNTDQSQYSNFQGTQVIFPNVYAGQIVIGSPDLDIVMEASPERIFIEGSELGYDPPAQTLSLEAVNGSRFGWEAIWSSDWLNVTPASGSAPSFLSVRAIIAGIGQGIYYDTILISSVLATNSPLRVPVELSVGVPQVLLSATPARLDLEAYRPLGDTLRRVIGITADATEPVAWSASNSADWLTLEKLNGATPDILTASVDLRGYAYGEYRDTIAVVSDIARNSPLKIPVVVSLDTVGIHLNVEPNPLQLLGQRPKDSLVTATLTVSSTPPVPTDWTANWDADWLQLSQWTGTTPSTIEVTADISALLVGGYTASVEFASENIDNSPVPLPVQLTVRRYDQNDSLGIPRLLVQNYPNPLNLYHEPGTTINFYLSEPDRVKIEIFNVLGQHVRTLLSEQRGSGTQSVYWDGRDDVNEYVASGHYFYRMTTSRGTITKRMTVIK